MDLDNIVISGYGIKAPGALDKESFRKVLENGTCTHVTLEGRGSNGASIVAGIIDEEFLVLRERNYKRYSRATRMAMAATNDAIEMAQLYRYNPYRIAIVMGTSAGAILEVEQYAALGMNLKDFPIQGVSLGDTHTLSASIAEHIGVKGPALTITTGCTASIDTIWMAKILLETGQVDACIVGGTDSLIGQWSINGFTKLQSISPNSSVHQTGVPFSDEHSGFVLSEGAGVLVLERETCALKRGQHIYGRIDRVLSRNEGMPLLQSDETGENLLAVYKETVRQDIPSYVNSQALGLKTNDHIERFIHKELFDDQVPITSIKGMIGHSFAAMGAMQVISSLVSMEYGFIPPTIKTTGSGFEGLPIVYETKYQPVDKVSITAHGNSGNNACLFLTK
jgi:3-oxoacyl-(acyl-carrier-protein) synthase